MFTYLWSVCHLGHRGHCLSCKGNVVLLQGNCVCMSSSHHIDMFHSHFTDSCHQGYYIKWSRSYAFWMVYVVSLSVRVRSQSSPITVYIYVTHLIRSHFPSNLASFCFLELCTLLLQTSNSFPCLLKCHILRRPQPTLLSRNVPSSKVANTALHKCIECSNFPPFRNWTEVSSKDTHIATMSCDSKLRSVFHVVLLVLHAETVQRGLPWPCRGRNHF